MPGLTALPEPALECFFTVVREAVELADRGEAERGYHRLLDAKRRMGRMGEDWSDALNRHYSLAMARYANRYGLRPR